MNILLNLAYDGTNYAGWQRQENALAVQQRLEEALSLALGQSISVTGASRTDAGVHALGQRACFWAEDLRVPLQKLPQVINAYLPADIVINQAQAVEDDFNPRFKAKAKTYRYQFYQGAVPNPLLRRYSAFIPRALRLDHMRQAAAHFVGRHDFKSFCASGSSAKTTVRTIFFCEAAQFDENGEKLIRLTVTGDGFLYNMVRIIAGTVLYAGLGKILPQEIPALIQLGDRARAGKTMPPEGLILVEVCY